MKDLALIIYTHSDYKDVWVPCFGQMDKYWEDGIKYIFVDKMVIEIPRGYTPIIYNDKDKYTKRVAHCLSQIKEDICLFQHEDMFLYNKPKFDILAEYVKIVKDGVATGIKLLKGGEISDIPSSVHPYLKEIPETSKWLFAIQPTIWDIKSLLHIYSNTPGETIWEFEINVQQICKDRKYNILYSYMGEPKRGKFHWDSLAYPYVATAISKGRWLISIYNDILPPILREYNINPRLRGVC